MEQRMYHGNINPDALEPGACLLHGGRLVADGGRQHADPRGGAAGQPAQVVPEGPARPGHIRRGQPAERHHMPAPITCHVPHRNACAVTRASRAGPQTGH